MSNFFPQGNSLIQLDNMFRDITSELAVFNSYGEGELQEINAVTTNNYPLLWCEVLPVEIHETYTTYNYRLYAMDIVFQDLSNRMEVQSQALNSLHHVLYLVRDQYGLLIEWNAISATPFIQAFNDLTGGWYIDCKIQIPWPFGSCDAPFKNPYLDDYIMDYDGGVLSNFDGIGIQYDPNGPVVISDFLSSVGNYWINNNGNRIKIS